jgi:hypothetical protein
VTRAALENAVRAWLVAAGALGGISTPAAKVIAADQDGTRPPLPYLLVRTLTHDVPVGQDETIVDDATPPRVYVRGQRYATVSINAFGETALGWLQRAVLHLRSPSIAALNQAAGIAVQLQGGLTNLSGLRDSHTETRFVQDLRVSYEALTPALDAEGAVELEQVVNTHEWSSQDGSPDRTEVVTLNLPTL